MNTEDYVKTALARGRERGVEAKDWGWQKALNVAYDQACNLFDGDEDCTIDDLDFDLVMGAYLGGYMGARSRAWSTEKAKEQ